MELNKSGWRLGEWRIIVCETSYSRQSSKKPPHAWDGIHKHCCVGQLAAIIILLRSIVHLPNPRQRLSTGHNRVFTGIACIYQTGWPRFHRVN